ncbi:helix-turn-helix domain-containing protein [Kitasatospora sp. NPDC054768]
MHEVDRSCRRGCSAILSGRRYRLELDSAQVGLCEVFGDICRVVWNTALEQRR